MIWISGRSDELSQNVIVAEGEQMGATKHLMHVKLKVLNNFFSHLQ